MNTDTLIIDIQSTARDATKEIDNLVKSLEKLQTQLSNTVKASGNFSQLKKNLSGASATTTKTTTPKVSTPDVGSINTTDNMTALAAQSTAISRQGSLLANFKSQLDSVGMSEQSVANQISKTTKETTRGTTETTKYETSLGNLLTVTSQTRNGLTRFSTTLKEVNKQAQQSTSFFKAMTSGISGAALQFQVVWNTVKGVASGLGNLAMQGAEYYESLNLFATTLADKAQEAMDWVNMFSDALYLDPSNVMQYMGTFDSLIKGLGVGTDDAYLMSQQLTQLTYDLASFKNLDFDTAFQKLQSGISGEIEPLRNVGVALSEATLQELAYSLGIEKSVSAMSEAEKAQLRYIQIMRSSTDWQADMGKTLTSPANAIRVLREQFNLLGRAIGNVFIPILLMAIPYVMAITEALTNLANALADILERIFGIDLDFSLDTGGFDTSIGDITGGLEDIGDTADKTKNKLNTMLAPFDELNNIQTQSKSDSDDDGLGGLGGDLGVDLPAYDALSKLTDKFNQNVDEARKNLAKILPIVFAIGGAFALWKIAKSVTDFFKTFKEIAPTLRKILGITLVVGGIMLITSGNEDVLNADTLWQGIAKQLGGSLLVGAGTFLLTKNIWISLAVAGVTLSLSGVKTLGSGTEGSFWPGIAELLGGTGATAGGTWMLTKNITITLAVTAVSALFNLGSAIKDLIDLDPTWEEISEAFVNIPVIDWLNSISQGINEFLLGFIDDVVSNFQLAWENISLTVQAIPQFFNDFVIQPVLGFFQGLWDGIVSYAQACWDGIVTIWNVVADWFNTYIIQPIVGFFTDMWNGITSLASDAWNGIVGVWNVVTGWFTDNIIDPIAGFFGNMWDGLVTGAENVWNGIKNAFSGVISFFQNIANTVTSFFGGIIDGVVNGISSTFKSVLNGAFTVVEGVVNFFIDGLNGAIGIINAIPGVNIKKISRLSIPRFEEGGFPDSASLFFANENGIPEMIGRIGNQTAVANNDQITTALTSALVTALNQYDFGSNSSPTVVYIGNKKVYEGYGQHVQKENDRYGTNMIRI